MLRSPAQEFGTGTEKYLLASALDELQLMRVRSEIAAARPSIAHLAEIYAKSNDARDSVFVRIVENAVDRGMLDAIGVISDGSTEAVAAQMRLVETIAARRHVRVPEWLWEVQARLTQMRTLTFTHTLDHLRAGRGIARRPHAITTTLTEVR